MRPSSTRSFEPEAEVGAAALALAPRVEGRRVGGRKRRAIGRRLAVIAGGIALAFAIAEIVIRVAGLAPVSFYTYSADLGWQMKPGASGWQAQEGYAYVRVNRDGFRGPDYPLAKLRDTLRIAVLGDSFTEAPQVAEQDTFCAVAQERLQAAMPLDVPNSGHPVRFRRAEVMNFGCDGYGTAQEVIMLERRVWRYKPT